jgi:hypothetical protein
MLTGKVDIERPRLLALLCVCLVGALVMTQVSLWRLRADLADSPVTLVRDREDLVEALQQAPFTAMGDAGAELFVIGLVGCEGCDHATANVIASLDRADLSFQVLLAPRSYPAPQAAAQVVATVARSGDLGHYHAWRAGQSLPALVTDPAEAEGYGELARQSAGRVAAVLEANGLDPTPPLVVWRRGEDFRALSEAGSDIGPRVRRDRRISGG